MVSKKAPKRRSRLNRVLLKVHKWAGLIAAAWLLVLGVTGVLLDHDEWRWQRQATVPASWFSERVSRLLPATVMRYIAVDARDPRRLIGGSERGLWRSNDRGQRWTAVPFPDGDTPQILRFVRPDHGRLDGILVATDDGIWRTVEDGDGIERFALAGRYVHSLSPGSGADHLVGIVDHDTVFYLPRSTPAEVRFQSFGSTEISGLPETVSLYRFVFDLHFGYGLFGRELSTLINDVGGIAFVVLALSGFMYWWLPRRWRRGLGPSPAARRSIYTWLYRFHAPVIGLVALIPILYLSITGIFLDHVYGFIEWGRDVPLERTALPPVYQYRTLDGELDQIVAYPGDPERLSVSTRLGVLHTLDGGDTWQADPAAGPSGGNLFRVGDQVIISNNGGTHLRRADGSPSWRAIEGLRTMISDGAYVGDELYLKNSRGFYRPGADGRFEVTDIGSPDLGGGTFYLFMADLHTGNVFHTQFKWVNDLIAVLAVLLVLSGPVLWWREKWR